MSIPVIHTKLYIPPTKTEIVIRRRLFESLNAGLSRKLSLVSAPAGFGKTTLVSSWLMQRDLRSAWVSLDQGDNDILSFFTYIVASLRRIEPGLLRKLWNILQSPQAPPREALIAYFINDLANLRTDRILVLDDYHRINSKDVNETLAFLLDNLPPRLHLVICSRKELPISVSNLRAQAEIVEITEQDLRFSQEEAENFLNQIMGLKLIKEDVARLEARTEGWVVGLQLAALFIKEQGEASTIISEIAGDNRYIADYLVDEVLSKQPKDIHAFLLQTSILESFSGPLCNAILKSSNSQEIIETLERSNLFIFPLDEKRVWYRYHHLFRELLFHRLKLTSPELLPELYSQASFWHEEQNLYTDAIRYALEAGDFQRTADLIEKAGLLVLWRGGWNILAFWFDCLPMEVLASRPKLWGLYLWTFINTGSLNEANQAIKKLNLDQIGELPLPEAQEQKVRAEIAVIRAALTMHSYADARKAQKLARQGMDLVTENNLYLYSVAAVNYGYASLQVGEIENARQPLEKALELGKVRGNSLAILFSTINLAELTALEGNLKSAEELFKEAIQLANSFGLQEGIIFSKANTGLSSLYYEWNRLDDAMYYLREGLRLAERGDYLDFLVPAYIDMAQLQCARGEFRNAHETVRMAEFVTRKHKKPPLVVEKVEALRAKIAFAEGRLPTALDWLEHSRISLSQDISYSREFELLCVAEMYIAKKDFLRAITLLKRMQTLAELQKRVRSVVQIDTLLAKAYYFSGNIKMSLDVLCQAIKLAGPEGYLRTFIDEGEPISRLLTKLVQLGEMGGQVGEANSSYLIRLVRQIEMGGPDNSLGYQKVLPKEPLTEREIEALQLVAMGHSNQQVADEMVVALSTVKWHLKNIYGKLGVNRRTQAVRQARELKLI